MPDIIDFVGGGVIPVLLVVVILVLVIAYLGSRYKVAGANEALIISGRREEGPAGQTGLKVVRGQGVIVLPLVHKVGRLHDYLYTEAWVRKLIREESATYQTAADKQAPPAEEDVV